MSVQKFLYMIVLIGLFTFDYTLINAQVKRKTVSRADSTSNLTLTANDSVKTTQQKSIVRFITTASLLDSNFSGNIISNRKLEATDYRFAEELLVGSKYAYIKKLGNGGAPTEVSLYGLNSNFSTFLVDGISVADRMTGFSNLHFVQSESIGQIELIPLSRGFLFGNSNIAAVNIISREPIASKPYSRLKYYQAPEGEGFIDGIFNITPFKKLKAYLQLTNHGAESYYSNSRFSNWMANVRLSYLLSPTETIRIEYKHVKANYGLYGGVDINATGNKYPNFALDDVVFDNLTGVVRFTNRYITNTNNYFAATLLTKAITETPFELSFYYRDDLAEFRQNISGTISDNALPVFSDNKVQTIGVRFRQDYSNDLFDFESFTIFERNKYITSLFQKEFTNSSLSTSLITTLKLTDKIALPSAYIKYLINNSDMNYFGVGGDLTVNIDKQLSVYSGFSYFKKPFSRLESLYYGSDIFHTSDLSKEKQQIQTFELKANANIGLLSLSAGYFLINNDNDLISTFEKSDMLNDVSYFSGRYESSAQGLSIQANFNLWNVYFNTNNILYLSEKEQIRNGLPKFSSNGGVYYIDTLFNNNLKMKVGLNYYSIGSRYEQRFDFEKGRSSSYYFSSFDGSYSLINSTEFTPSFQLDFFFAGRIQEKAVVYFTWENLLNARYFEIPYYPARPRGLRFGVAWEFLD